MKKTIILTGFALLTIACGSVKLVNPTQADVDRAEDSDYTLAQMNQGKILYEQHCNTCHKLKDPISHNEGEWNSIVPKMVQKANKKSAGIDENQQDLILKYLVTMSTAAN